MKERRAFTPGEMPAPGKATKAKARKPSGSGSAPVFRILGALQFLIGLAALGVGLIGGGGTYAVVAGVACLFWAAVTFAVAEALEHLASIAESARVTAARSSD